MSTYPGGLVLGVSRYIAANRKERFLPLCPDFALELRLPSDSPSDLQAKMREYLDNGARLGWLIDPVERSVYVFRPAEPMQRLDNPAHVAGDPVLAGFVLDLGEVWNLRI